jgi:hypothetical protein
MEKESMALATPNSSNDAALNAQLDITRDASIANLRTQSEETRQQYRDEAARIESQKQRSAEVVQSNVNAALDNRALAAEANYQQAIQNAQAVETAAFEHLDTPPDGSPKVFKYNHLNGLPLNQHADIVRTSQELLKARDVYLETHPEQRNNPAHQARIGEDGFVKFGPELQGQIEIASPEDLRAMPLDELRRNVQRPNQRQVNPNEPLVTFIDNPDGTFDAKLVTGETFRGFKADENRDAIRKLAESKVNTRRHYENLAQQQQSQPQQQPANGQQPPPQAQPQAQPGNDPAVNSDQSLTDWFLDETAKRFGYQNGNEMVADQNSRYQREQQNNEVLEQYKNQNTVSQFFMEHPEYPNTDQANNAIETIINRNGWEWTPDSMAAAHALAVQNRVYQPLTQEDIAVANGYAPQAHRPVPPPMLKGGSPESQNREENLYEIPLDVLRKKALAAQTGGR